jgi:hypothetical protein
MPNHISKVNVTTTINVNYDVESILQLIVNDLRINHGLLIEPSELHVDTRIEVPVGYCDDDDYYTGGRVTRSRSHEIQVMKPIFNGITLTKVITK